MNEPYFPKPTESRAHPLALEAAALGMSPEELEKGRHNIQMLIYDEIAKPIIEIDYNNKEIVQVSDRNPGENNETIRQRISPASRVVGCIIPDRETGQFLVVDADNLQIGLFRVKDMSSASDKMRYLEPGAPFTTSPNGTSLIARLVSYGYTNFIATSTENPELINQQLDLMIPKMQEVLKRRRENRNTSLKVFNADIGSIGL